MNNNQEILNISDLYGYDDNDMPDSDYPIRYRNISKAQKTDTKLQQEIVSNKDYTHNTFLEGDQNYRLIFRNSNICLPTALQMKTVDWYHEILSHTGETHTEHTLRQHFY